MVPNKPHGMPLFEFAFHCLCGTVIEQKVREAIVESQAGGRVTCQSCGQWYRVTKGGADPIEPTTGKTLAEIGQLAANAIQRHDAGREVPALRFTQSRGKGQWGLSGAPLWNLRLPNVRRDQERMGEPTDSPGSTGAQGRQQDEQR